MALESFYGGKPGISPVIRERFKYINTEDPAYKQILNQETILTEEEAQYLNDAGIKNPKNNSEWKKDDSITWTADKLAPFTMDECFKNPKYTNVWYSEFCIIDTDNKENPNNGKLYRRTLKRMNSKKANDSIYAEYMGQIVGPRGSTPNFYISSIEDAKEKATNFNEDNSIDQSRDYTYLKETKDDNGNTIHKITYTDPGSLDDIAIIGNSGNIVTVPGKDSDGTYHDNIKYTWCNVRQDSEDGKSKESWVYLGFEIPYTVFEINSEGEEYFRNASIQEIITEDPHPFYKIYNLKIPHGSPGVSIQDIFIVGKNGRKRPTLTLEDGTIKDIPIYDNNGLEIMYNSQQNYFYFQGTEIEKELLEGETYWVAKIVLYNYAEKNGGELRTPSFDSRYIYLGLYREIESIQKEGYDLKIIYSSGENKEVTFSNVFPKKIKNLIENNENKISIQYDDNTEDKTDIKLPINYISEIEGQFDSNNNQYILHIGKNDNPKSPNDDINIPLIDVNDLSVPEIYSKTPNPDPNGDDIEKKWDILQINMLENKSATSPWNPTNSPWIL